MNEDLNVKVISGFACEDTRAGKQSVSEGISIPRRGRPQHPAFSSLIRRLRKTPGKQIAHAHERPRKPRVRVNMEAVPEAMPGNNSGGKNIREVYSERVRR